MARTPRRALRAVLVLVVLGAAGSAAAACGPDEQQACPTENPPHGLAVAVGDRSNSPKPSWPDELEAELSKVVSDVEAGRTDLGVTMVRADGVPTIGCVRAYQPPTGNDHAKEYYRNQFKQAVSQEIRGLRATTPETDTLAALGQAGAAAGPGGTVALIDSGLQTVAPLDFRANGLLNADPDRLVAELGRQQLLPDLADRKVILVGIGYTAPPQAPLNESQRGRLIELWQRIATASGAREVVTVTTPNTTDPEAGLPPVGEVPVPPAGDIPLGCDMKGVFPDDGDVGFLPGTTDFRDEGAARRALAKVADWLGGAPGATAAVTGSVAHYGDDDANGLPLARAEQVRRVLVEGGVAGDRVRALGAGWGPFPSKTAPPDPTSDPLNRRVVIVLHCG